MGDAVIRENEHLKFVSDDLMGDDAEAVKRGLNSVFEELLKRRFENLLLAHGRPIVKGGKEALRQFTGGKAAAHR